LYAKRAPRARLAAVAGREYACRGSVTAEGLGTGSVVVGSDPGCSALRAAGLQRRAVLRGLPTRPGLPVGRALQSDAALLRVARGRAVQRRRRRPGRGARRVGRLRHLRARRHGRCGHVPRRSVALPRRGAVGVRPPHDAEALGDLQQWPRRRLQRRRRRLGVVRSKLPDDARAGDWQRRPVLRRGRRRARASRVSRGLQHRPLRGDDAGPSPRTSPPCPATGFGSRGPRRPSTRRTPTASTSR
jgi:hypothetical protein